MKTSAIRARDAEHQHLLFHIFNTVDGCTNPDCILRKDKENESAASSKKSKRRGKRNA